MQNCRTDDTLLMEYHVFPLRIYYTYISTEHTKIEITNIYGPILNLMQEERRQPRVIMSSLQLVAEVREQSNQKLIQK